ncbi:CorA family divalent cation transporter [Subtercola sp. YIM 133946]
MLQRLLEGLDDGSRVGVRRSPQRGRGSRRGAGRPELEAGSGLGAGAGADERADAGADSSAQAGSNPSSGGDGHPEPDDVDAHGPVDLAGQDDDDAAALEVKRHLRDVLDHVYRVIDRSESFRTLLENALTVHSTLIAQKQNDEMTRMTETSLAQGEQVKKISSWAAVLFAPTLVAAIYGMNFSNMPELKWFLGYPFALALMLGSGFGLYLAFKKRGWL